jgi:putative PEP-CTERM system TPR-repeat lipoprotein
MQTMLGHGTTTTLAADRYTRRTWWWVALSLLLALAAIPASAIQINPFDTQEDEEPLDPSGVVENLRGKNFDKAVAGANELIASDPKSPVGYNMLGGAYAGRRDFAAARKNFERALALDAKFSPAQMNLAQLDLIDRNYAGARKRYEAVLANEPGNAAAMLGLSRVAYASGDAAEGARWLASAKKADPAALPPRLLIARQQLQSGDLGGALAELNDARKVHPANPVLLNLLGQAQLAGGQSAEAAATFAEWVKIEAESALAHARLAKALEATGDLRGAEQNLNKALALAPGNAEALHAQALLDLRKGRAAEALEISRKLQQRSPGSPVGIVLEGDALAAQKDYAGAMRAYERAMKIVETGPIVVKWHIAAVNAGATQRADERLLRWLKDNPQDDLTRQYLAGEYGRRGNADLAIPQYQAILDRQPQNVVALNNLALLYIGQKDVRGLELAQKAYTLKSDSPGVMDTYGWALVQYGNAPRGLELIRRAAGLAPNDPEIRLHLAGALLQAGDREQARAELQRLLSTAKEPGLRASAEALLRKIQ